MSDHASGGRQAALLLAATALLATGVTAFAQRLPADLDSVSGARLPYLTRQDLGDAGQELADVFARDGKPTDPARWISWR